MSVTPVPNSDFRNVVNAWVADPTAAQFTNSSNTPQQLDSR